MQTPAMILFDYGHTLAYEPDFDRRRGSEAVLAHAVSNPDGVAAEDIQTLAARLFARCRPAREAGLEIQSLPLDRFLYDYLRLSFALPPEELERIFWDAAAPGTAMPYANEMLAELNARGIRTGVISNISFGGSTLRARLDRLLPENRFEFVLATSDYVFRKPEPLIFQLALKKAGLDASEVWFCGDHTEKDVAGAAAAGLFPVWYHSDIECFYKDRSSAPPDCPHLYLRDWRMLAAALEN